VSQLNPVAQPLPEFMSQLIANRFGTQLQAEHFKAELHARRWAPEGESIQQLYQDICRLVTLACPSAETSLVTHIGKEASIAVLRDGKLQLDVMKQELQNVEAALSHAIKFEAFEQSLTSQDAMIDHNDGHAVRRSCSVCTVAGPSEVGETATLSKLIGDLQDTLVQVTMGFGVVMPLYRRLHHLSAPSLMLFRCNRSL